jgi:DNA-directed RNA polymerase subunit beta'
VELFEARKPKGEAITSTVDGTVVAVVGGGRTDVMPGAKLSIDLESAKTGVRRVVIQTTAPVAEREKIVGHYLANDVPGAKDKPLANAGAEVTDKILDAIEKAGHPNVTVQREFAVPYRGNLDVRVGQEITAGDTLTKGPLWPQDVLSWRGLKGVAEYLVQEVQKVYKSQGIQMNDKHIEVIVRQMLRKRRIKDSGDTELMPGKLVDASTLEVVNTRSTEDGGQPATADFVLLGITEAALATESFLSAASFQKTTKVLTEAATHGRVDVLSGLKENVIIGRLIPAGTGLQRKMHIEVIEDAEAKALAEADPRVTTPRNCGPSPKDRVTVDTTDIFPLDAPIIGGDLGDVAAAGFSVGELSSGDDSVVDEVEPSEEDLVIEEDLLGGDIDGFPVDTE